MINKQASSDTSLVVVNSSVHYVLDLLKGTFYPLAAARSALTAPLPLILCFLFGNFTLIDGILLLIPLLQVRIDDFPHISDYFGDLGDAQVRIFLFDILIDVLPVEEKSAQCLFWRLRRQLKSTAINCHLY